MAVSLLVLVLIVASVVVVFLGDRGDTALLPEDTPEGIVQRYLQAIEDGDSRRAYGYLNQELRDGCTQAQFREGVR